jgi:cobalt-zinc-cadmium resistance protein CzcA
MVVRLSDALRTDIDGLSRLLIPVPGNASGQLGFIALSQVASLDLVLGPNQISRENGKRLVIVSANVRGRDIGSFVEEAEAAILAQVKVPAGYWTTWGGQFEQLKEASERLRIVVPVALLLAIVQSIMHLHQGHADVSSQPGRFTRFSLVFPRPCDAPTDTAPAAPARLAT